jgi:hypothetical protein
MRYLSGLKSRRTKDKRAEQEDAVLTLTGPLMEAGIAAIGLTESLPKR